MTESGKRIALRKRDSGVEFFPWADAMAFGLGILRLAPQQFWGMTPRELQAALNGVFGSSILQSPMTRKELSELMKNYPDHI